MQRIFPRPHGLNRRSEYKRLLAAARKPQPAIVNFVHGAFFRSFQMKYAFLRYSAPALFLLTACVHVPPPASPLATDVSDEAEALPTAALDAEILYDVLLGEIAGQRGQVDIAADALARAVPAPVFVYQCIGFVYQQLAAVQFHLVKKQVGL